MFWKKSKLEFKNIFPRIRRSTVQFNDFIITPIATWLAGILFTSVTPAMIASVASVIKASLILAVSIGGSLWSQSKAKGKSARAMGSGGQQFNTRVPSEPVKLVYGQPKIGANWIFAEVTGGENEDLHAVMTWGEGEDEGIPKIIDYHHIEHTPPGGGCPAGLKDLSIQGTYSGTENLYRIEIVNGKIIDFAAQMDGAALTDETVGAKNATINDMNLFPAVPVAEDYYLFGIRTAGIPDRLIINLGTAGVGTWTLTWEYWGYGVIGAFYEPESGQLLDIYGNGWFALAGVSDGTNGFHNSGSNTVSFTAPGAVGASSTGQNLNAAIGTALGNKNVWLFRARIAAFTSCSTVPLGTQAWLSNGADETFKWSDGGAWSAPTTITGAWQALSNGVEVRFGALTDHGPQDKFKFMAGDAIWLGERLIPFYNLWDPWGLAWLLGVRDVVTHTFHTGTSSQTVDTTIQPYFPSWQYALRYTSYSYFIFKQLKFWIQRTVPPAEPYQAVPEVMMLLKGRKIYDTRTSTTAYSRNPALVWYDLMTNDRFGLGISSALIDNTSVNSAANWCDSNNFYFDGAIRDRENILDVIEDVLVCFRAFYIWSDGKYRLKIFADDASILSLTEADVEIGDESFRLTAPGLPETPSTVKCIFYDEERNYTENFATWGKEDEGEAINPGDETFSEIPLVGIVDYDTAKKLAKYYYRRSVINNEFNLLCHSRVECLEPGDMVSITHEYTGWTAKKVRVKSIGLPQNGLIPVTFIDENSNIYDQSLNLATRTTPVWYLTGYIVPPPVGLLAETGADENTVNVTDACIDFSCNHLGDGMDYVFYVRRGPTSWGPVSGVESHYVKGPADISIRPTLRVGRLPISTLYEWWMTGVHAATGIVSVATAVKTITTWNPSGPSMSDVSLTLFSEGPFLLLVWSKITPNPAIYKWKIYRNTTNNSATATLVDEKSAPTRSYRDTAVTVGVTYYYWLKGETVGGGVSNAFSAPAAMTHRHTSMPFQFDSIDSGDFLNEDGTIGYVGTLLLISACDNYSDSVLWTHDGITSAVGWNWPITGMREGEGCFKLQVYRTTPWEHQESRNAHYQVANSVYNQLVLQRFEASYTYTYTSIAIPLAKIGSPTSDLRIRIYTDVAGFPGVEVGSVTITAASIPANLFNPVPKDFIHATFSVAPPMTDNSNYWIVLSRVDGSWDASNYYHVGMNDFGSTQTNPLKIATVIGSPTAVDSEWRMTYRIGFENTMLNKYVNWTNPSDPKDLSTKRYLKIWMKYSDGAKSFKLAMGETAISDWNSPAFNINEAGVWEWKAANISAVAAANRNAITFAGIKFDHSITTDVDLWIDYLVSNSNEPHPAMYFTSIPGIRYFVMGNLGISGGQIILAGTDAGDDLTLRSTSHATKGSIFLGAYSAYDEANDRLGINELSPDSRLHISGSAGTFADGIKLEYIGGNGTQWSLACGSDNIFYIGQGLSGAEITKFRLTANGAIIGSGEAGVDYTLTFNGETNSGVIIWMEDEDYFKFSDDVFINDAENLIFGTTTGSKIGTAASQKIGFFNATPIVQPSATGETTGFTQGSGTEVRDGSTFSGNVGSTAYRISDIVKHLKNLGLIAS